MAFDKRHVVALIAGVATAIVGISTTSTTASSVAVPSNEQDVIYQACTSRLGETQRPMTPEVLEFLQTCQEAFTPAPSESPSPSVSPSTSPTVSPSASSTPTATPTIPTIGCPPLPAFPDENCTGYRHTGVTLVSCPRNLTIANAVYDRCQFNGTITIAADNIKIKRSLVNGGVVGSVNGNNRMRGLQLEDVEILGSNGTDQLAAIGTENYSCLRCHIHKTYRGFALGNNVRIIDSYSHDFRRQTGAHQTAASTHGGSNVFIDHSRLRCQSDRFACSNGISFYSEMSGGINNVTIQNSHISTDAGYGIGFFSLVTGKPYGITNTKILNNTFGSWEYGIRANWPSSQAGNVWSGNVQEDFDPVCRC